MRPVEPDENVAPQEREVRATVETSIGTVW
jgi:hypothetical protein